MKTLAGKIAALERPVVTLARIAVGWHLAYLGVWALTTTPSFSWCGRFRCARWIFGGLFKAVADSAAMGAVDALLAWGLLVAGVLIMLGRAMKPAAATVSPKLVPLAKP